MKYKRLSAELNLQEKGIPEWEKEACARAQCYESESGNPVTSLSLNTAKDTSQEMGNPTMTKYDNNYDGNNFLERRSFAVRKYAR